MQYFMRELKSLMGEFDGTTKEVKIKKKNKTKRIDYRVISDVENLVFVTCCLAERKVCVQDSSQKRTGAGNCN